MIAGVVGQYRILERIGSGDTGVVYEALDTRLNRHVAKKLEEIGSLVAKSGKLRIIDESYTSADLKKLKKRTTEKSPMRHRLPARCDGCYLADR